MPKLIENQTVFEAVVNEIVAKGYAGATMKQIARRASVSELTLFRKYESKPKLIAAAVAASMREMLREQVLRYTGDVSADFQRIAQLFILKHNPQHRLLPIIMSEMTTYPELAETLVIPNQLFTRMAALITRYQAEGALVSDIPPLHIAGALVGPLIINSTLIHGNPALPVTPLDPAAHVRQFLNGYLADKR